MADIQPTMASLIERSSLGTPQARGLRSLTDPSVVDHVLAGAGNGCMLPGSPGPNVAESAPSTEIADAPRPTKKIPPTPNTAPVPSTGRPASFAAEGLTIGAMFIGTVFFVVEHTRKVEWLAGSYRGGDAVPLVEEHQLELAKLIGPSAGQAAAGRDLDLILVPPGWGKGVTATPPWQDFPGDRQHLSHLVAYLLMLVCYDVDRLADEASRTRPTKAAPPDSRRKALAAYLGTWTGDDGDLVARPERRLASPGWFVDLSTGDVDDLQADAVDTGSDGQVFVTYAKHLNDRSTHASPMVFFISYHDPEAPGVAADFLPSASPALGGFLIDDDLEAFVGYSPAISPSSASLVRQFTAWFDHVRADRPMSQERRLPHELGPGGGELVACQCPVAPRPAATVWVRGGALIICGNPTHPEPPLVPSEDDTASGISRSR